MYAVIITLVAIATTITAAYQLASLVCDADDREEAEIYGEFE